MTLSAYLDWLGQDLPAPANIFKAEGEYGPDLVMGFATSYGPRALAPFVRSLRAHSKARIALFADAEAADFLAQHGVDRIAPPQPAGWAPHLLIGRFKYYLSALAAYPDAHRVLITDVRDVAFQGDPFGAGFPDDGAALSLFAETDAGGSLGAQGANRRWLEQLIGRPLSAHFLARPCVCGGTILGDAAAVIRAIKIVLCLCAIQRSGALSAIGADQAALNLIAHWGLAEVFIAENYGRTATIGYTAAPSVEADGRLRNPNGGFSPILHQYDRHAEAKAAIEARWTQGLAPDPPRAKAKRSRLALSLAKRLPEWR